MGAGVMAIIGVSVASWAVWKYELQQGPFYRRYKQEYIGM